MRKDGVIRSQHQHRLDSEGLDFYYSYNYYYYFSFQRGQESTQPSYANLPPTTRQNQQDEALHAFLPIWYLGFNIWQRLQLTMAGHSIKLPDHFIQD